MHYIWMVVIGFVVGVIARVILPGTQSLGLILTTLLGMAGAFVAGFLGQATGWYAPNQLAGFVASVVGAVALLFVAGKLKGSGSIT